MLFLYAPQLALTTHVHVHQVREYPGRRVMNLLEEEVFSGILNLMILSFEK